MRPLLLILALALGCATPVANEQQLREREWKLVWVQGFDTMPTGVATPTIRFGDDGHLGGTTSCNSAGASYTLDGDHLTLGPVVSTKRACLEPQGNALEAAYLGALGQARRYRISNGHLELLDAGGRVVARFS